MSIRRSRRLREQSDDEVVEVITPGLHETSGEGMEVEEIFSSPETRAKITDFSTQTTPGLLKNGPLTTVPCEEIKPPTYNASDDDDQTCPICFEEWTNSGAHRLASLNCGHLFGRSCIERWLKDPKNKCCPQCKCKTRRRDIRNIFAKSLKAVDTSEQDQAKQRLVEEKYKRSKAEEGEAKAILQCQLLRAEMEKLKKQVELVSSSGNVSTSGDRQPLASVSSTQGLLSHELLQPQRIQTRSSTLAKITKKYTFQKSLQVSQKEARVMAYDRTHMLMVVSKPSPNQLFAGYGILKVCSLESRSSEYIRIHQKPIRDAKFNNTGDQLILTASIDKTLKLTSALNNSTVLSYTCPGPVWACAWNDSDNNYVYAGLQNGTCLIYDFRNPSECLDSIKPRLGVPCPIVSLAHVPTGDSNAAFRCNGLLVGTLQGGWFARNVDDSTYTDHQLLFPEGSCSGLYFEPKTRHCLLSQRPGKKSIRTTHTVCHLSGDASDENPVQVDVVKQCYGGNRAQSLTRSHLFPCPDYPTRLMICAGDESSSSTIVWDGDHGNELQKLPSNGGTVFDVMTFSAYESNFLATLTEQKLSFYQWP